MKVIAINGSPRKKWSTATLLQHTLEGAASKGAQTELVHLYDLDFKGCISCFACKKIGGKSYGRCAVQDGLTPLLERIIEADALVLGSPFYLHAETGEMRSCLERLVFPYLTYTPGYVSIAPKQLPTALVYTMNIKEEDLDTYHQGTSVASSQGFLARTFGSCDVLLCCDTLQFDDYSKYLSTCWDPEAKAKRHREVFPQDCQRAFDMGARLVASVPA